MLINRLDIRVRGILAGLLLIGCARAQVSPKVSGVLETYFVTDSGHQGSYQQLTWAEVRARITKHWSATWSGYDAGSYSAYDEAYVRYENDLGSIRAGRIRTSFGFSDWSENFYSGFNHKPIIREVPLAGRLQLDRDDDGAEVTTNFGKLELQAAALEIRPTKAQVGADRLDHETLTAQYGLGDLTTGANFISSNNGSEKIYGANLRYTVPHWILKGEAFQGVGGNSGNGAYLDAAYRIPSLTRTQLVGRTERLRAPGSDAVTYLHTVGIRQIFSQNLTTTINYGWGNNLQYSSYASASGLAGWTTRVMFQVHF